MKYLVWQILTCLWLAGLFGVLIGWLLWGIQVHRMRRDLIETQTQLAKIKELPRKLIELQAMHSASLADRDVEVAQLRTSSANSDAQYQAAVREMEERGTRSHAELASRDNKIAELQNEREFFAARVSELEASHAAKDAAIAEIEAAHSATRVTYLEASHTAKDATIAELHAAHSAARSRIDELEAVAVGVPELEANHAELQLANSPSATGKAELTALGAEYATLASHAAKGAAIGELEAAHNAARSRIAELESRAARLPVPGLEGMAALDTVRGDSTIAELQHKLAAHLSAQAHFGAQAAYLLAEMKPIQPFATYRQHVNNARHPEPVEVPAKAVAAVAGASELFGGQSNSKNDHAVHAPVVQQAGTQQKVKDLRPILDILLEPLNPVDISQLAF
jgi:uncharacterized coiled-coil protein SlyX